MAIRKIDLMHRVFGKLGPGYYCRDCDHLCSYQANRKWYKCEVYGLTHSEASDWSGRYDACGMFNKEYDGNDIIRLVRGYPAPPEEIQGQETLFEGE